MTYFKECHHKNYSICAYMFDAQSNDDQEEKNHRMKLNGSDCFKEITTSYEHYDT